ASADSRPNASSSYSRAAATASGTANRVTARIATSMIAEPTARRTGTVLPRAGAAGRAWSGSGSGSGCSTASRVSFTLTPSTVARVVQVGARVDGPLTEEFPAVGRAFRTVGSSDTGPGRPGDPAPQEDLDVTRSTVTFDATRRPRSRQSPRWPSPRWPASRWPLSRWPLSRWPLLRWPVSRWPGAASRAASVVAAATWLLGIITVASALVPPDRARLRLLTELLPYQAADAAAAVAAALGVLLLYLAGGLRRRKRRAWVA